MNEYEVNIDFDEASKEWRKNKLLDKNGNFYYVCGTICKNGKKCRNKTACGKKCHKHNKNIFV